MAKKYKFITKKEHLLTTGSAAASAAVFGTAVLAMFNPIALGLAGGYAAYKAIGLARASRPSQFETLVQKGYAKTLGPADKLSVIAKDLSDQMGRKAPPTIYLLDIPKMKARGRFGYEGQIRRAMKSSLEKMYAAVPGTNILITTQEAIDKGIPDEQTRFIIAHELSHLKSDSRPYGTFIGSISGSMSTPLYIGSLIAGVVALAGFGVLPMTTLGVNAFAAIGALITINFAKGRLLNYASRVREARADRNALYLTRDLNAAIDVMNTLHHRPESRQPRSKWREMFATHPSYTRRVESLKKSFNIVSKYPQPAATPPAPPSAGGGTGTPPKPKTP